MSFHIQTGVTADVSGFHFYIRGHGEGEIKLSDLEAYIDKKPFEKIIHKRYKAHTKSKYEKGTDIHFGTLAPQIIENIEVIGKVWGFLKYYHPAVTKGEYDWDAELFEVLPQIARAENKTKRNQMISKWIDKYGKIKQTANYPITDSTQYSRVINLDWLNNGNLFSPELTGKLNRIRFAWRDEEFNYYLIPYRSQWTLDWDHEKSYPDIQWEDEGFRLLTLFRFWNIIEYCYPYRELTDRPWEDILKEYIPAFLLSNNEKEYQRAILQLAAEVGDAHVGVFLNTPVLLAEEENHYYKWFGVNLLETKTGEIAIQRSFCPQLLPGDIIVAINSVTPEEAFEKLSPYISASNDRGKRDCLINFFLFKNAPFYQEVTINRNGKLMNVNICRLDIEMPENVDPFYPTKDNWKKYELEKKNIRYIDISCMDEENIKLILSESHNAAGIIIDLRKYPGFLTHSLLEEFLLPSPQLSQWYSKNQNQAPGNYRLELENYVGTYNPDYFKGKVAILVNEHTMSYGESSAMSYRKAPQRRIIGSTTGGADGNTSIFPLPGNIEVMYTARGLYYPGWELCQRTGVKIDIEVRPTPEDLRKEKDVWIETAIQYILSNK
ncbi:MAG: S41 family peptidase [Tannerellaceae bacterium]|nr:S41 family peptidase [Tannerellaceae bacterium]